MKNYTAVDSESDASAAAAMMITKIDKHVKIGGGNSSSSSSY